MNDSDCPSEDQLVAMVEGALGQDSISMIESHVDGCESCAAVLAGLGGLEQSQVRRTLGRYQLDRRIAAGGMGEVWAAWDPQLRRELAIKFVRPDRADDGRERDRLLREARALARLTHPNVLAVHDVGEIDGEVFLVTELVAGDTLATRGGPTSDWRLLTRLYVQAARGLASAHAAGLVHRDVKPANLLIGGDGRVRVADFGLAVRSQTPSPIAATEMPNASLGASSRITAAGHIAGTPAYMAPEQRAGMPVEAPADQFALCVALGEGIAGRRPPTAVEHATLRAFMAERRTIDSALDELCGVLARGLALDPDERFPSMTALADALDAIVAPIPDAIGGERSGRNFVSGGHRTISASGQYRTPPSGNAAPGAGPDSGSGSNNTPGPTRARSLSGGYRPVSGGHKALAPDGDPSATTNLDAVPHTRRSWSALKLVVLTVIAGAAGAAALYFAMRGGSGSASTPPPAAPIGSDGSATAPADPAKRSTMIPPPQDRTIARPGDGAPESGGGSAANGGGKSTEPDSGGASATNGGKSAAPDSGSASAANGGGGAPAANGGDGAPAANGGGGAPAANGGVGAPAANGGTDVPRAKSRTRVAQADSTDLPGAGSNTTTKSGGPGATVTPAAGGDDSGGGDDMDDDVPDDRLGPGMRASKGSFGTAGATGPVTLADVNRAIQRRDGKLCRGALAQLTKPPPSDFRVASAHATCEMVAGNCEGGKREMKALRVRENSDPSTVDRIDADLWCDVNDANPTVRLRRLTMQLEMFTYFECGYYLPASRAAAKVAKTEDEKREVAIDLTKIAACYSFREDCTTAKKILGEAQVFIPKLGVDELAAACR